MGEVAFPPPGTLEKIPSHRTCPEGAHAFLGVGVQGDSGQSSHPAHQGFTMTRDLRQAGSWVEGLWPDGFMGRCHPGPWSD